MSEVEQGRGIEDLLREGIAAAKAGQRERAAELLTRVVAQDERNVMAWMWLSGAVDSLEDREVCLENVLALDPNNAHAQKGLAWVRQQMQQAAPPPSPPAPAESVSPFTVPPDVSTVEDASSDTWVSQHLLERAQTPVSPAAAMLRDGWVDSTTSVEMTPVASEMVQESPLLERDQVPVSAAAAMLGDEWASQAPPPAPEPEPLPDFADGPFADEYACPYCAAPADPEDKKCPVCRNNLWVQFRKQEKRSGLLWVLISLQLGNTFMLVVAPMLLLLVISTTLPYMVFMTTGTMTPIDTMELFRAYAGLPHTLPQEVVDAAFSSFPPLLFWAFTLPGILSAVVCVGLVVRWKPVYYLLMVDAGLEVVASIVAIAITSDVITGLVGFGFALSRMAMIFNLGGDFEMERRRIFLRVDRGVKGANDFMIRSDHYAKQRMWALAALHLRSAMAMLPDRLDCRLTLVTYYIRLRLYDLAERVLEEARGLDADNAKVAQLSALLRDLRQRAAQQAQQTTQ